MPLFTLHRKIPPLINASNARCALCIAPLPKPTQTIPAPNSVAQMVSVYGSKVLNTMMTRSSCVPTANAVKPPAFRRQNWRYDRVARGKYGKKPLNPKLVRDFVLSHTDLFGSIATPFAPLVNAATSLPLVKKLMHKTIGVHDHKTLPKYSHGTFRRWFKQNCTSQPLYQRQVAYFHGCYVNYNHPQLGKDFVRVMNAMNIGVRLLDSEKCCGVPLIANGFHNKARKNALHNVKHLTAMVNDYHAPVLSTSSTCSFTLQQEYPHVLGVDNSQVVDQIHYVTRFLLKEFMSGNAPKMKPVHKKVVYHTPCHLERSGNVMFTIELLKMIPGLELVVLDSECCGLAGTYGFKEENYEVSKKIGSHLFDAIQTSDADYAVTDCETCKWQIEENAHLETIHPVSLLAMALIDEPRA